MADHGPWTKEWWTVKPYTMDSQWRRCRIKEGKDVPWSNVRRGRRTVAKWGRCRCRHRGSRASVDPQCSSTRSTTCRQAISTIKSTSNPKSTKKNPNNLYSLLTREDIHRRREGTPPRRIPRCRHQQQPEMEQWTLPISVSSASTPMLQSG